MQIDGATSVCNGKVCLCVPLLALHSEMAMKHSVTCN